jgi:hypothetical protein
MNTLIATSANELKTLLQQGVVTFGFHTKKGNLRIAKGTLDLGQIPPSFHPKGNSASPKVLPYYDLEVGGWRSFQVTQPVFLG